MYSAVRISAQTRVAALAVLILFSQLLLLAHQVLDEHDDELSCELCLQAKVVEWAAFPVAEHAYLLLLVFTGISVLALPALRARALRRYSPRAPPQ